MKGWLVDRAVAKAFGIQHPLERGGDHVLDPHTRRLPAGVLSTPGFPG